MPLEQPFADPVLIFAFAMLLFVFAPLLFERLRVPGLIGLIVSGAVVGPNALNLLERGSTIVLLGTVGLLYLMFMVGLELDLHDFTRYRNRSIVFGTVSFVVPQLIGTLVGRAFGYDLPSSLLLGSVFASHTVLAYPIISRLGIIKNLAVTTTLGGTIITEILALSVLAIVAGTSNGDTGPGFLLVLAVSLAVYIGVIIWGVPILARWFFRNVGSEPTLEFAFVMAVLFGAAYLAHAAHSEPIIGALLVGLALNRLIPESGPLMNRIHFVGDALFIPFFLLSVGMLVDVRTFTSGGAILFAAGLAGGVIFAKWLAAFLTERVFRYTAEEGWVMFGLSVPHASGTLAIVLVGFDIGLFDQTEVNGVILTILATCLVGPWVVQRYGRKVAIQEEQRPYEPRQAPQRILIPISNPATEESLLDLAMILRDPSSTEPLLALMVVPDFEERTDAQVAEAERTLSHAVIYGAGADVPVAPITRVDQNIAAGIARGIAETRSSIVVVGWKGRSTTATGIFGTVLDQLMDQTKQLVVVAKLGHALNTTKRVLVVLPPLIHRHPGFFAAARAVKVIANRLGASVVGLTIDSDPTRMNELFEPIKPSVATKFERTSGWSTLLSDLRKRVRPDDIVAVVSSRQGTLPWHPKLERLPSQLAHLVPESFLIIYPPEADTPLGEPIAAEELPSGLLPERIVHDLPSISYEAAIRYILERTLQVHEDQMDLIVEALVSGEREFSTELKSGVVVPHTRLIGLEEPLLFLGTSREGIVFPNAQDPARLIFILLSPTDRPQDHLTALGEIARLVSNEEAVQELLGDQPVTGRDSGTGI